MARVKIEIEVDDFIKARLEKLAEHQMRSTRNLTTWIITQHCNETPVRGVPVGIGESPYMEFERIKAENAKALSAGKAPVNISSQQTVKPNPPEVSTNFDDVDLDNIDFSGAPTE